MSGWDSLLSELRSREWDYRLDGSHSGQENMDTDVHLLENVSRPTLRLYTWNRPTLSLGRHQRDNWVNRELCERLNVEVVRRPTGGRALLHMPQEITYAVALPKVGDLSVREAFEGIAALLAAALRRCGLEVEAATSNSAPAGKLNPHCGEVVTAGEVCWRGRKLVGSAQVRSNGNLLQHGSLVRFGDNDLLRQLMPEATARLTLEDLGRADLSCEDLLKAWDMELRGLAEGLGYGIA